MVPPLSIGMIGYAISAIATTAARIERGANFRVMAPASAMPSNRSMQKSVNING